MMERLVVNRRVYTDLSTIGDLYLEGQFFCNTIELSCRKGDEKGLLAIPAGQYPLKKTYSPRFKKDMWQVLNVPGREGIRIHPANSYSELDGCIAPGKYSDKLPNWISASRMTMDRLDQRLLAMSGDIWIAIAGGTPNDEQRLAEV